MKLAPIEVTERLYVRVARRIAELIDSGQVGPGDKLPSERELAEMLKVSRPSIREAMIALEVSGVIEVRTGSGIYVVERQPASPAERVEDTGIGPFEIFELRQMIEPDAAALAAERMTDAQIAELKTLLEDMERHQDSPDLEAIDRRLHIAIAQGTENTALALTVEWLWDLRLQSGMSRGFHRAILDEGIYPALAEHREVVNAIASRDPEGARRAMRTHLEAATQAAATHFGSAED